MEAPRRAHPRALVFVLAFLAALSTGVHSVQVPASRHSRTVVSRVKPQLERALEVRGLRYGAPIFVRIFKQERELELWVQGRAGFELFRTYPICRYSGRLGPKQSEGDMQSPEGFYTVSAGRLNPTSEYFLAFNLGYPNALDRAHGRTGGALMVHGGCVSAGCYAMTDAGISEIYALAEAALRGGQSSFHVHAFPFRLSERQLTRHAASRWAGFWRDMKPAFDYFEQLRVPPVVRVRGGRYEVAGRLPERDPEPGLEREPRPREARRGIAAGAGRERAALPMRAPASVRASP